VLANILLALDTHDLAVLTLLDLLAAYDMVNHVTLLRQLEESHVLHSHVLSWFQSYLDGHMQYVCRGTTSSTITFLLSGVLLWLVLGPNLFMLYTADLLQLVNRYQLCSHLYTDDTHIYSSCHPSVAL